jgi:hypothetical protein
MQPKSSFQSYDDKADAVLDHESQSYDADAAAVEDDDVVPVVYVEDGPQLVLPQRRAVQPVLTSSRPHLDRSKFAKSSWNARYRYAHPKLYLLIDRIDGPALRSTISQRCLSMLAACDAVSILASCEHINTTLLWPNDLLTRFNWHYDNASTFLSQAIPEDFILIPTTNSLVEGASKDKSLDSSLMSLTARHRELLEVTAKETLALHAASTTASSSSSAAVDQSGVPDSKILSICKNKLILRSSAELKTLLKELVDQRMIKIVNEHIVMTSILAKEILVKLQRQ